MSHRHSRHTPRVRLRARLGGLLRALTALTAGGAVLIAAPAAMWRFVGWPLPDHIPTWNEIAAGATAPLTEGLVLGLIGCLFWYAYTLLALSVAVEITATAGGWPRPRLPTAGPAQALAAVLVGTILTGVLTAATRATPAPPTTAVLTAYRQAAPVTAPADPTSHAKQLAAATRTAASTGPSCTVAVHDSLWSLAEFWLGDGLRWRDIWALNEGRVQADGTRLTSPDLLRPGWVLHLPPDARPLLPPASPDAAVPPAPASVAPAPATIPAPPDPTTPSPATPSAPPRSTVPPGWTPTIPPAPRPPSPPVAAPMPAPQASRPAPATSPPATPHNAPPVRLPSGAVLPLGLITALAAAVTVARLLRTRRRPVPTPPGQPTPLDQPLPLVIREILRASRTPIDDEQQPTPDRTPPEEPAPASSRDDLPPDAAADMPTAARAAGPPGADSATGNIDLGELPAELLRTGRLDLRGPTAVSTALALVLHLLAAHHCTRHAWPARLIIPSGAVDLLDLPRPLLGTLPQVTVTASTDAALDLAGREALRRARLADGTSTTSLDELRAALPDEMIPMVLLLAATPTPREGRLTAPAETRGRLGIYTVTVDPTGPAADDPPPLRWQLTAAQASDLLSVLAEAADQPTAPHQPTPADLAPTTAPSPAPAAPLATAVTEAPPCPEPVPSLATAVSVSPDPPTPRAPERPAPPAKEPGDAPRRIRLVLFGRPTLHVDGTPLTTGVRTLSLEIAAYLALHPDGISGDRLASELLPDHDPTRARNQIYRAVAALRDTLRTATADPTLTLITGGKSGYGLDRTLVTVDVWEFNAAVTAAGHATEDGARIAALTQAAAVATATPLGDTAYDWAAPVVHDLEHRAVDALADLADLHADDHPDQALAHLEHALTLTPTVEDLYRHVMRLHATRQRPDAVRRTYQRLRDALDAHGLDVDPTPETQALLAHLTRAPRPAPSQTGPRRIIRPALPRRPEHPST